MSVLTAINYYKTNVNDEIKKIKEEYSVDKTINMINTLNKEYEELENRYNDISNALQRYKQFQRMDREIIENLTEKNEALIKVVCKEKWNTCSFEDFVSWIIEICKDEPLCPVSILEDFGIEYIYEDGLADFFEFYWDDVKDQFHEDEGNDYEQEYLDDYENWIDDFREWYVSNELCPTDYYYDDDGNLYYHNN